MSHSREYCITRGALEEHWWALTSELFAESTKMVALIGGDHLKFLVSKKRCVEIKSDIADAREDLAVHRREHGC